MRLLICFVIEKKTYLSEIWGMMAYSPLSVKRELTGACRTLGGPGSPPFCTHSERWREKQG